MALDRAWFNALIDDDGSNTVGTVWNKPQIDALLDSVDAALVGVNPVRQAWVTDVKTAEGVSCVQGGTTIAANFSLTGDMLFWNLFVLNAQIPATTNHLVVSFPFGLVPVGPGGAYQTFAYCYHSGSGFQNGHIESSASALLIVPPTAWAVGAAHVFGQGFYFHR